MTAEDEEIIRNAARLLSAGHRECDYIAAALENEMLQLIQHRPSSGGHGYVNWIASLQSFGEIILALAKREKAKARNMNI